MPDRHGPNCKNRAMFLFFRQKECTFAHGFGPAHTSSSSQPQCTSAPKHTDHAPVAKLVDAPDLGSGGLRCVGSSPIGRTKCRPPIDCLSIIRRPYSYQLIPIPNKKRHTIWLKNRLYAGLSLKLLTFAECICKKNEILVYIHPLLVLYHIREIKA